MYGSTNRPLRDLVLFAPLALFFYFCLGCVDQIDCSTIIRNFYLIVDSQMDWSVACYFVRLWSLVCDLKFGILF